MRRLWTWIPFKAAIIVAVLLQIAGEHFPSSTFPMYSNFSDGIQYVYLADLADVPVAQAELFHIRSARTKKIYKAHLNDIRGDEPVETVEHRRRAGAITLQQIVDALRPETRAEALRNGARLYRVEVTRDDDGHIRRERELLAELPAVP